MLVLFVLSSILISYVLWTIIKMIWWAKRKADMTANIPGPKLLQSAINFAKVKNLEDFHIAFQGKNATYMDQHKIMKFWLGPKLFITLANSKYIETILSGHQASTKDKAYEFLAIYGNGMVPTNGKGWQELRKPLNRIMTKLMIESNLNVFHNKALTLNQVLSKHAANGEVFNIRNYMANYTVDTLSVILFGSELNELKHQQYDLVDNFGCAIEKLLTLMVTLPYCINTKFASFSKNTPTIKKHVKHLWNVSNMLLDRRIKSREEHGENISEKPKYFADVLTQKALRDGLSRDDTARLSTDTLVAGFDTTSVVLSSAVLLLAMNPEHQEALYKELVELLGKDIDVHPTAHQLDNMPYLTRVLKEVGRIFSVPGIFRQAAADIDLGEHKIPKGSTIYLSFYNVHRNPDYWSHPNEFYPDHFLPETEKARPKHAYIPFSWGPRSCPGKLYAMTSMKIALSILIRRYKFETDLKYEDLKFRYSIMLEIAQGYPVRIKTRD